MAARIHQYRIARWLRRSLVMLTLVTSCGVQAAGSVETVAPTSTYTFDGKPGACQDCLSGQDFSYYASRCSLQYYPSVACTGYASPAWFCNAVCDPTNPIISFSFDWEIVSRGDTCPTSTPPYTYNIDSGMCERPAQCPEHSTGTLPSCTCDAGFEFDSIKTSCVPVSKCSIDDLPPITDPVVQAYEDNPDLSDTADLKPKMQDALKCLTDHATALGCTPPPSVGSAFRPPAYNQHLIDLWKKWVKQLMKEQNPACAARKAKIQAHFKRHKLLITQPPVSNSRHTQGLAVDVTINLPPANIKTLARGCGLIRPKPVDDPVHFQFP